MAGIALDLASPVARPFTTFCFVVEIKVDGVADKVAAAAFSEVDGLEMTIEAKTIREGGRNDGPIHLAGGASYGQLTLKRGMTANRDFWKWARAIASDGKFHLRAEADVVILSSDGATESARFILTTQGILAIEELQLAYETLSIAGDGGGPSIGASVSASATFGG